MNPMALPPEFSPERSLFLFLLLVPGVVSIQVYGLLTRSDQKELKSLILEVIAYSSINSFIWFWLILRLIDPGYLKFNPISGTLLLMLICILSPAVLSVAWYWFRLRLLYRIHHDHPAYKTSWDHFIGAVSRQGFWVLLTFKDGTKLGGFWGERSSATTYPHEPELYIEEVWRVDSNGCFVEKIPRTLGTWLKLATCERVEFFTTTPAEEEQMRANK